MHKLRLRFIIVITLITLIVMSGLGFAIGHWYKDFHLKTVSERLESEARLGSYMAQELAVDPTSTADEMDQLAETISERILARVTILDLEGQVLGESASTEQPMDNHLDRPEIRSADSNEDGYEIRYSETLEQELLYYAVPILDNNEQMVGYFRLGLPMTSLQAVDQTIWAMIAASFLVAMVVIALLIFKVTREMMRPIDEAVKVAKRLAKGDYSARTFENQHAEVGQLSRSLNMLAYNLDYISKRHQAQQERMETLIENMGSGLLLINVRGDISVMNKASRIIFQVGDQSWLNRLYHDVMEEPSMVQFIQSVFITETKQRDQLTLGETYMSRVYDVFGAPVLDASGKIRGMTLVLHDITEQKKLEQVRKDFVANVSHELKTPITSIKGFSETLLDGAMNEEQLREKFLKIILKESERLQSLIHDLLELSKIERSYFQVHLANMTLFQVAEEVITMLKDKANEKGIHLSLHAEGDSRMTGDPERMKQIIINIVNNAIMYTPSNGHIEVSVKGNDSSVELSVADTGIGIEESEVPRVFERFYRVDRARSRNSGGTGLGLAIVKHLAEAHHANIHVSSKQGEGTTFTLLFPREQPDS
ncbi:two-component system histidine kinase PnpS [Alkalicoccobacillus murimartini]|uniref:histidine kinase n=1 Tax=Alkalicoccobacillus murimartini TaxID=171685 RepID=A0ABT9YKH9_9BACI|nr:ATP-binding protein [Alkalicoccobacillus murimartini]MDQ0208093.1 two-component system phosphate regulon sensor histidine kinase PhoR [Alkalicoccobacillus murimartini]